MYKLDPLDTRILTALKHNREEIPYIISSTLNSVAFEVREAEKRLIGSTFDNPVPFTRNSVLVDKAQKTALKAAVYIRDEVADYLDTQVDGGERDDKAIERGLRKRSFRSMLFNTPRMSQVFGSNGTFFIPANRIKNAAGNITKAKARKILDETKKPGGKFFLFDPNGDGKPLVMERMRGGDIELAMIGISSPQYSARFKFHEKAEEVIRRTWDEVLGDTLDRVLYPSFT